MDIVFDGQLEFLAFHDPERGEVQVLAVGVGGGGLGVELGEDAHLGVDEDDAFAQLALRGAMARAPLLGVGPSAEVDGAEVNGPEVDQELDSPAGPPEADLAEAEWPIDRPVTWRLDGATLTVVLAGARRSQWARVGRTPLYVALDLETEGEAYVAALVHTDVLEDPGLERCQAALQRLGEA
jgi:hypothetical protein